MIKKIVLGAMAVALVAFVMVPSASASCNPAKTATTFGNGTAYWLPATTVGTASVQSWQLGAPGTWNSAGGTVACPNSFLFPDGPGFSLAFDLGSCGSGCPAPLSTLVTLAQNRTASGTEFLLATIVETPADSSGNFQYASQGDHTMIPVPRPRVLSSARVGSAVNLSVTVDSIAAGLFGPNAASAVTGFNILTASSATDPGTDSSAYSLRSTIASAGGAAATGPISLDCTNPLDQWIVTQIQLENGTVLANSVSGATRVHCDPALANPKHNPKIKPVPRPTLSN